MTFTSRAPSSAGSDRRLDRAGSARGARRKAGAEARSRPASWPAARCSTVRRFRRSRVARAVSLDANVLEYLGALSARAYAVVYGVRRPLRDVLRGVLRGGFPRRAARRCGVASWPRRRSRCSRRAVGFAARGATTRSLLRIVPEGLADGRSPARRHGATPRGALRAAARGAGEHAAFASFLFAHNTQWACSPSRSASFGGLPTLLLLLHNGLILGAFVEIHHARGPRRRPLGLAPAARRAGAHGRGPLCGRRPVGGRGRAHARRALARRCADAPGAARRARGGRRSPPAPRSGPDRGHLPPSRPQRWPALRRRRARHPGAHGVVPGALAARGAEAAVILQRPPPAAEALPRCRRSAGSRWWCPRGCRFRSRSRRAASASRRSSWTSCCSSP